jgi:hypothetical protein
MKICTPFTRSENDVTMRRTGLTFGWKKPLAAAALLACGTGAGVAQLLLPDAPYLPNPVRVVSTVPTNGDVNPYGVAFIPKNFIYGAGKERPGDILVANFNNKNNMQGTGTTIVRIPAAGGSSTAPPIVFYQGTSAAQGMSTALGVLQYGFVVVGSLPTTDGTSATAQAGSLLVINNVGKLIQKITDPNIDGPWDMTLVDHGDTAVAYVTNSLNGTIARINFRVNTNGLTKLSSTVIASGYFHRGDPATLFAAPCGSVYDAKTDQLYVASSADNLVFAVPNASTRTSSDGPGYIVYQDFGHLHGALALAWAANGNLLVSNSDGINPLATEPSEIVEFTTDGNFVKQLPMDPAQGGSFGLNTYTNGETSVFAAVDDNQNTLTIWTLNVATPAPVF